MEEFLNTMDGIDAQWSSLMDKTVDQIGVMSDRILYTETLILDEGKQIGIMSDRIVTTEALMANLTEICANCEHASQHQSWNGGDVSFPNVDLNIEVNTIDPIMEVSSSITWMEDDVFQDAFGTAPAIVPHGNKHGKGHGRGMGERKSDPKLGLGPIEPIIEFMNHTMYLMEAMSNNVTNEMYFMEQQIGVMADRIVETECLIMNMSQQIGVMADRIVETEYLMSNMTAKCCKPSAKLLWEDASVYESRLSFIQAMPPPHCNGTTMSEKMAASNEKRMTTTQPPKVDDGMRLGSCAPWDVMCLAAEKMMEIAEKIEDSMYQMCLQMLNMTTEGAIEIGHLADDIVEMEKNINIMGLEIGKMADMIVEMEQLMLQFAQHFCTLSPDDLMAAHLVREVETKMRIVVSDISAMMSDVRSRMVQRVQVLRGYAMVGQKLLAQSLRVAQNVRDAMEKYKLSAPLNPVKWVELMEKIMSTMLSMSTRMVENMQHILDAIDQMAGRIMTTAGDIEKMANQIVVMMGRMQKTEEMMLKLMQHCGL
eukprot:TRINITY_DN1936_c0_g1_i2.p1 TRINITY_DN1936_c0_g1~~TRINITY_DN1936_c0_g1_i2.p1  ORF type:complete len:537 (-),score=163.64 TRINITY_DN1936_c0_g1_i2:48-1658(-)